MGHILFLIRTLNIGGAERALVNIANRMAEDGFSVTVQTLLDEGYYREKLNQKVHYKKGFHANSAFVRKVVMKLFYLLPAGLLGRILIGKGYSHLVAFVEDLPTKIIYGCPWRDVTKIAWIHTDLYKNEDTRETFGTQKGSIGCYDAFDQVLCVSNDAKNGFIRRIGPHRAVDVQYNPIDKNEIIRQSQCEPSVRIPEGNTFRLVALGRLKTVKGFDLLTEAMVRVRKEASKPVALYIIGGGSEMDTLKEMIQAYHLQDTVFLCGQQTNPYSIMRLCDLQIISSRAEGYSLALCEGHFLGLPVVSTKCTGPLEIIGASNGGILVDISANGLADGILTMVNNPAAFAKYKQNVENWSENYNADVLYRQIESRFS